jgi:ComF family protein
MRGSSVFIEEPIAEKESALQRLRKTGLSAWADVVGWITPPLCLGCRQPTTAGASLCVSCWQKLAFIDEPVCDMLGTPFEFDQGEGALSPAAIADPPPWDKARAAVSFDESSKHLIHLLKYRDTQEAGIAMARMMAAAGRHIIEASDIVVPVPLHRFRLWQRRFNQAAYLGQRIAVGAGKPCVTDVLLREKRTRQQVGLTAEERRKNVARAFVVPPEKRPQIDGKTVLLVDDVRTTGATVSACSKVLKQSGAVKVHVLSFALVLEPARLHIDV